MANDFNTRLRAKANIPEHKRKELPEKERQIGNTSGHK